MTLTAIDVLDKVGRPLQRLGSLALMCAVVYFALQFGDVSIDGLRRWSRGERVDMQGYAVVLGAFASLLGVVILHIVALFRDRRIERVEEIRARGAPAATPAPTPASPTPPVEALMQTAADVVARRPIDWRGGFEKGLDGLLRYWWLILIVIAALVVFKFIGPVMDWIGPPSGREVAAEANQQTAEANQRTAEAEAQRSTEAVVIVEDTHTRRRRTQTQTEQARAAIAEAPDLESGLAAYRERALRLRDEGRAPAVAAVQQHTAPIAP